MADALEECGWGGRTTIIEALALAESLRFDGPYLHDYACLSMRDPSYLGLYARRVRALAELPSVSEPSAEQYAHLSREGYRGGPGDYIPGMLEIGLRVFAGDVADRDGALHSKPGPLGVDMVDA